VRKDHDLRLAHGRISAALKCPAAEGECGAVQGSLTDVFDKIDENAPLPTPGHGPPEITRYGRAASTAILNAGTAGLPVVGYVISCARRKTRRTAASMAASTSSR